MSKRKPYSKVENAKALRKIAVHRRNYPKHLAKLGAPDWFVRLSCEITDLEEKMVKLGDFVWVKDTEDSPAFYSPEAKALSGIQRQLLVRQYKAMNVYLGILGKRHSLGFATAPAGKVKAEKAQERT